MTSFQRVVDEGKIAELDQKGRADRLQELLKAESNLSHQRNRIGLTNGATSLESLKSSTPGVRQTTNLLTTRRLRNWNFAALDSYRQSHFGSR